VKYYVYMSNLHETLVGLQSAINCEDDVSNRRIMAGFGITKLQGEWTPGRRLAHAYGAYAIDELVLPPTLTQYDEVMLSGNVPRLDFIETDEERVMLALPFYDCTILGPAAESDSAMVGYEFDVDGFDTVLPMDRRVAGPLLVPIVALELVAFAP